MQLRKQIFIVFLFFLKTSLLSCNWGCMDCEGFYIPALHFAVSKGDRKEVERLLDEGADINEKDYGGRTALHKAGLTGRADMAELLIQRGANVHARDEGGYTALHEVKTVEVAKVLLDNGAKINTKAHRGKTPLFSAISLKNTEVALFLINNNKNIGTKEDALQLAVIKSEKVVAELLLEKGADPYAKREETSAFSIAQSRNKQEFIKLFEAYAPSENK